MNNKRIFVISSVNYNDKTALNISLSEYDMALDFKVSSTEAFDDYAVLLDYCENMICNEANEPDGIEENDE